MLASETGVHAHHQNVVDDIQNIVQHGHRRGRIDHHAGLGAFALDHSQRPVQMRAGFLMHQNLVGARLDEQGRVPVGIGDHQVHVQDGAGGLAQRFDHRRSDGHVRHEMAIHHVQMKHAAAGRFERGNLLAQTREIGRENRWQDLNHEWATLNYHGREKAVSGVAAGQPQVGSARGNRDDVFIFFPFERTCGIDQPSAGLQVRKRLSRIFRWRRETRQVALAQPPLDLGIARQRAGSRAGRIDQNPIEFRR